MVARRTGRALELLERVKGKEVDDRADLPEQVLAGEEEEPPEHELFGDCTAQSRQPQSSWDHGFKHIRLASTASMLVTSLPRCAIYWSRELRYNCR